uniref:Uncharacterized protein n=1 Tax=Oryza nivara TaxID=4536 RepID=A0A0E0G4V3_ORYNI
MEMDEPSIRLEVGARRSAPFPSASTPVSPRLRPPPASARTLAGQCSIERGNGQGWRRIGEGEEGGGR